MVMVAFDACLLSLLIASLPTVSAFSSPKAATFVSVGARTSLYASGKGFGSPPPENPKEKASQPETPSEKAPPIVPSQNNISGGQRALAELRRQRAEQRDAELRKVKELRELDNQIQEAPAAIPEAVATRMGQRMLPFVGIPLFGSLGAFVAFWYFATYKNFEFQPVAVAVTTIGLLVVGLLGITFSIFSTSWDEDREGSFLGFDEVSKNLDNVRAGLSRGRENAFTRDKIASMSEDEIERAIADLDKRDGTKRNP